MDKILVPTDFSEEATNALNVALGMAKNAGSSIKLMHVIESPYYGSFSVSGQLNLPRTEDQVYVLALINQAREKINTILEDNADSGIEITFGLHVGSPYKGVVTEIEEETPDLVVMGSKGSTGLDEVLVGSNTEKVVRYAKCPVLTVKSACDVNEIDSIVYATDLVDDKSEIVHQAKELQKAFNATLHLVKINTPNNFEGSRHINKQFKTFVEKFGIENYTTEIYNDSVEEDGIIFYAEEIDADVIAMATSARKGLFHLLSGSIAEDVVNHAKRLVWTYSGNK